MQVQSHTTEEIENEKEALRLAQETKDAEEMEAMCKKHNVETVYKVAVPLNENYTEVAYAWLKYPSFEAYSIALTLEEKHPLKGKLIMLQSMWLEGDETLKKTETPKQLQNFLSLCTVIDEIVDLRQALIKKKSKSSQ